MTSHLRSATSRRATVAAAVVLALLAIASPARAGSYYDLGLGYYGAQTSDGWSMSYNAQNGYISTALSGASAKGVFNVGGGRSTFTAPESTTAHYDAPANTSINAFTWTETLSNLTSGDWNFLVRDQSGYLHTDVPASNGAWAYNSSASGSGLDVILQCGGPHACFSNADGGFTLTNTEVGLTDNYAPRVAGTATGDIATNFKLTGTEAYTVPVTDSGSGVYRAFLYIDGALKATNVVGNSTGHCADYTGNREFDRRVPCALSTSASVSLDTTTIADGDHRVEIDVEDAAGNVTTAFGPTTRRFANTTANNPGAATNVAVVGGDDWRSTNDFNITWTSPAWGYPIVKANYLLCPGTNPFALNCLSGSQSRRSVLTNIESLSHIAVPSAGTWSLWLTLEDNSGTATTISNTADPVFLRYDGAVPSAPTAQRDNGWLNATQAAVVTRSISPPASQPTSGIAGYSYTTDGTDPDATIDAYGVSPTVELRGLPQGVVTFKVRAISASGVASSTIDTSTINIDRTAPTTSLAGAPAQDLWSDHSVSLTLNADDGTALSGMAGAPTNQPVTSGGYVEYRLDGGAWTQTRGASASVVISSDGTHQLDYRAVDVAGNIGDIVTRTVRVDAQAPTAPTISGTDGGWSTTAAARTVTPPAAGASGLAGLSYTIDGTTPDATPEVSASQPFAWRLPADATDGTYTLKVRAISGAGIAGPVATRTIAVDRVAPLASIDDSAAPDATVWHDDAVTLGVAGADATSGVDHLQTKIDNNAWQTTNAAAATVTLAADGEHTVSVRAVDVAGNVSAAQTKTVRIDTQAPPAPTISGANGDWATDTDAAARTITPPAAGASGLAGLSYTIDGTTPDSSIDASADRALAWRLPAGSADGTYTLKVRAISGAGIAGPVATRTIAVDRTAPTVTIDDAQAPDPSVWHTTAVTLAVAGADATSGVDHLQTKTDNNAWQDVAGNHTSVTPAEGEHTVSVRAVDVAGNVSPITTKTVRVDRTAPPAPAIADHAGWLNATQAAGASSTFNLPTTPISGLAGYSITTDGTDPDATVELAGGDWRGAAALPDGVFTLKARAISAAGLVSPVASSTVRIDRLAPTATIAGVPAPGRWSNQPVTLTLTGTDQPNLSGMAGAPDNQPATDGARVEASVDGGPWQAFRGDHGQLQVADDGRHSVSVRAVDVAGNVSEQQNTAVLVDTIPPTGQGFQAAQDGTKITVSLADATSGLQSATIEVAAQQQTRSSSSALTWKALPTAFDGTTATADLADVGLSPGAYAIRARVRDLAGNETLWTGSASAEPATLTITGSPTAPAAVVQEPTVVHDTVIVHDLQTIVQTVDGGPAAGSLLTPAACRARGLKHCDRILIATLRQSATAGRSLVLRVDGRTPIATLTARLPGVRIRGRRAITVTQYALNGRRHYSAIKGTRSLRRGRGDETLRVLPGQLRLRGLRSDTAGLQLVIPLTAVQANALHGRTINAVVTGHHLHARLPGSAHKSATPRRAR